MAASLGIDGLASGLNTTDIINQLMQVEAGPQTLLKTKQTQLQSALSALQGVNVRVQSVKSAAAKAADPTQWNAYKATSSSTNVAASASSTAQQGSLSFTVGAVATRQVSLSAPVTDGSQLTADNPPTLTVKKADGSFASVTAESNSLADMVSAINGSDLGIKATAVRVAGGSTPSYRLQFTSDTTGADGGFELYVGDQAAVEGATATRLDASLATAPQDASVVLWQGTAYEETVTQSSNTFDGLMTGVSVTLGANAKAGDAVTVDVATDASAVKSLASDMVNALSVAFGEIASQTATKTSTDSTGRVTVTGGVLTGQSAVRQVQDQLTQAAIYPVDGKSLSTIGLQISRDGTITFDEAAFSTALANDPEGTASLMQAVAARVSTVADSLSNAQDGTLTRQISSNQTQVDQVGRQILDWDDRLAVRRESLQATYSALEVSLSNLQAQSTWLSGQLASLPSASA